VVATTHAAATAIKANRFIVILSGTNPLQPADCSSAH